MKEDFYINELQKVINLLGNIDSDKSEISDYNLSVIVATVERLKDIQAFLGKGDRE